MTEEEDLGSLGGRTGEEHFLVELLHTTHVVEELSVAMEYTATIMSHVGNHCKSIHMKKAASIRRSERSMDSHSTFCHH